MDVVPIRIVVIGGESMNHQRRQRGGNSGCALISNRKNSLEIVAGESQLFVGDLVSADPVDLEKNLRQRWSGDFALNRG